MGGGRLEIGMVVEGGEVWYDGLLRAMVGEGVGVAVSVRGNGRIWDMGSYGRRGVNDWYNSEESEKSIWNLLLCFKIKLHTNNNNLRRVTAPCILVLK